MATLKSFLIRLMPGILTSESRTLVGCGWSYPSPLINDSLTIYIYRKEDWTKRCKSNQMGLVSQLPRLFNELGR